MTGPKFVSPCYISNISENKYTLFDGFTDNMRGYFTSCD